MLCITELEAALSHHAATHAQAILDLASEPDNLRAQVVEVKEGKRWRQVSSFRGRNAVGSGLLASSFFPTGYRSQIEVLQKDSSAAPPVVSGHRDCVRRDPPRERRC